MQRNLPTGISILESASPKLRIFLADDNPTSLLMLSEITRLQFEIVATAPDGTSALQLIRRFNPDVAVLDLEMPGLTGIEVARELAKSGDGPPVIICSAHATWDFIEAAREAGASGFVLKHNCARDLVRAVTSAGNGRPFFPAAA